MAFATPQPLTQLRSPSQPPPRRQCGTPRHARAVTVARPRTVVATASNVNPSPHSPPPLSYSTSASVASRRELWRSVAALKRSLEKAVSAERFGDAARLRDEIETLTMSDDYMRVQRSLEHAIEEQRFMDAARLRDDLEKMIPPPPEESRAAGVGGVGLRGLEPPATTRIEGFAGTASITPRPLKGARSETETDGIVVTVESFHMPEHDAFMDPSQGLTKYTFGYRVRITNNRTDTVQLVKRHWIIENVTGPENHVRGSGVVGRQPVLEPGESFEYTSACPLACKPGPGQSVLGSMRGEYTLVMGDTGTEEITAQIGRFFLVIPESAVY